MTRDEILTRVKLYLNVNASQQSDDISDANWAFIIQDAYKNVWVRMRGQVSRATLLASQDITWTAGSQTLTLPAELRNAVIYDIWQLDGSGNPLMQFGGFFETRNVLRLPSIAWNTAGFTLRVYYIPEVETLSAGSEPVLIPPQHHEVIVWEALRVVKMILDKEIPESWLDKIEEIEHVMVKELSTRPVVWRANISLATNPMARPLANSTL